MSSSDERTKALANVIEGQAALLSTGSDQQDWFRSVEIAQALLDSPTMRDLLAEERAKALRGAADDAERMEAIGKTRADRIDETTREQFSRHPLRELAGIQPHRLTVAAWLRGLADEEADR